MSNVKGHTKVNVTKTMPKSLLFVLAVILVVGGIYLFGGKEAEETISPEQEQGTIQETAQETVPETPQQEIPLQVAPEPGATYHEIFLYAQNDSDLDGIVHFDEQEGKLLITLVLLSAPEGVTQPAHIHSGLCEDLGNIKYPLTFPMDGGSTQTTLDMTLADLLAEAPWAVNVHKSIAEPDVYVSCGGLML